MGTLLASNSAGPCIVETIKDEPLRFDCSADRLDDHAQLKVQERKTSDLQEPTDESKRRREPARTMTNANHSLWDSMTMVKEDSRAAGVIDTLFIHFSSLTQHGTTTSAYLCSPFTDYIGIGLRDLGWGCGYRNCQMLMSFLQRYFEDSETLFKVGDIPSLQTVIERAWSEGFDPEGANELKHKVYKTRKWIGTTEVFSALAYLGVRSTIIDFDRTVENNMHKPMMDWIQSYFEDAQPVEDENGSNVYITHRPPLYLQHSGHSRTVIGIEILSDGRRNLIMFDPSRKFFQPYRSKTKTTPHNRLRPFRVDEKSVSRYKQYQILILGEVVDERASGGHLRWNQDKGYILSQDEREEMKRVTSYAVLQ